MKYLAVVSLMLGSVLFAARHSIIVTSAVGTDPTRSLPELNIISSRVLGNSTHYLLAIETELTRAGLRAHIARLVEIESAEDNGPSTLETLEPAFSLDSRIIFVIDNIEGEATYLISEAELDSRIIFVIDGSGPEYSSLYGQYHVSEVNAHLAWETSNGVGLTVAILDTGVDLDHPFLVDNLLPGHDFVDDDAYPDDTRDFLDSNGNLLVDEGWGHGTHVAGIVKTIAPGVSILPVRVVDSDGFGTLAGLIEGIYFAIDSGVDVINLSMSISSASRSLKHAVEDAATAGILVVTSAGNSSNNHVKYPSGENGVVTVAALDATRRRATFSNFGHDIQISAPGVGIVSTHPDGTYVSRSGTSMSAPIVSAQAALIWDVFPTLSGSEVISAIMDNAQDISSSNRNPRKLGAGLADVHASLED